MMSIGSRFVLPLVIATLYQTAPPVSAGPSGCQPSSASEMIAVATTYLDGLTDQTGASAFRVLFAPDARRTEFPPPPNQTGAQSGTSGAELAANLATYPHFKFQERYGNVRWVADVAGCQVVAFWLLNFSFFPVGREEIGGDPFGGSLDLTVHIAERFLVSGGLIHEIEAIVQYGPGLVHDGSCWPRGELEADGACPREWDAPAYGAPPGCSPSSSPADDRRDRNDIIKPAARYLEALVSGDTKKVQLAGEARRSDFPSTAVGRPGPVAEGADAVRARVEDEAPARTGIRDVRWLVDTGTCQAVANYLIDYAIDGDRPVSETECKPKALTQPHLCTIHVSTRFLVIDDRIREIESIEFRRENDPGPEGSCWPRSPDRLTDETYRVLPCPFVP